MKLSEEGATCPICGASTAYSDCTPGACRSAAPEYSYPSGELVCVHISGGGLPFWPTWMRALGAPYGIRPVERGAEVLTLREFLSDLATAVRLVPGSVLQELPLTPGLFGDVAIFEQGSTFGVRSWDPAWIPIGEDAVF